MKCIFNLIYLALMFFFQLQNDRLNRIEGTAKTNSVLVDDLKYKEKVSFAH